MRRHLLLLPLALLLPACGGGGDEKEAYVREVSLICTEAGEERSGLTAPTAPAGFADYADALVGIAREASARVQQVEPPADDAEELRRAFLDPLADLVVEGEAFAGKVRAAGGDQAKLLPLLGEVPTGEQVDREFLAGYGLDSCVEALAPVG